MKTFSKSVAALSFTFLAVSGPLAFAAGVDRPATEEEMVRYCPGKQSVEFGIVGVGPSREKPFDLISCAFNVVRQADCKKITRLIDVDPKKPGWREQFNPVYQDACVYMF